MDEQEVEELKQRLQKMLDNQLLMANRRLQQSISKLTGLVVVLVAAKE